MRVLLFCSANLNIGSGSEVRARLLAQGLNRCGADVCVVSSGIPEDFSTSGISGMLLDSNKSWEESILAAAKEFKPDIFYGITEAGISDVSNVATSFKCPVVFDLHGIGVVEILELGGGYGSRLSRIKNSLRWLSKVPKANAITVANPKLVSVIERFNKRTVPVIGSTDITTFCPNGPSAKLGNDASKIQVLYAGNYFKWQGVDLLIKAIKKLVEEKAPFEFTFMGSVGRNDATIKGWKSFLPDGKVHFIDSVDYSYVADYYRGADVLVVPRPFMLSTYLAFPQKIVDYMASGRTIVATDIAPHRWALESPRAGVLCPPTAEGLAEGIRKTADSTLRSDLSINSRIQAVELFDHLKQSKKIYSLFNEILQGA